MSNTALVTDIVNHVQKGILKNVRMDRDLKKFVKSRGKCQHLCIEPIMASSLTTMFSAHAYEDEGTAKEDTQEVITGAVMACWPGADRDAILDAASDIVNDWTSSGAKDMAKKWAKVKGKTCPNDPDDFPMKEFKKNMTKAMDHVIASDGDISAWFDNAMACQRPCMDDNVAAAAKTMWEAGTIEDEELCKKAFAGALHACAPRLDHKYAVLFVDAVAELYGDEALRLYASLGKFKLQASAARSMGYVGPLLAALALALIAAAMVARKVRRRGMALLETDDQVEMLAVDGQNEA
jgi:hypothetical protein